MVWKRINSDWLKNDNFELIQDDLRNLKTIVKSLKEIDGVIH